MKSFINKIFSAGPPNQSGGLTTGYGLGTGVTGAAQGGAPTSVTAALAIIGFLAKKMGTLPRKIIEVEDATMRPQRAPEYQFLWGTPRPGLPGAPWWITAWAHMEGWANVYIWKRKMGGDVVGLDLIHPSRVKPKLDDNGVPYYIIDGEQRKHYTRDDIVHIPGFSWDGVQGIPPVTAASSEHRVASYQMAWQRSMYRKAATPGGIISTPAELDPDAVDEFYELWEEQHAGPESVGGVILLQGGAEYTPVSMSPSDMQLIQSKNLTNEQLLSIYAPGLPHHMLGWKSNTSNFGTGIEQQGIHMTQHVFLPRMYLLSEAISLALLPPELALWWDTAQWLEGDSKSEAEVWTKMRQNGIITREEWRRSQRMPPLDIADDILVPKNATVLDATTGAIKPEGGREE